LISILLKDKLYILLVVYNEKIKKKKIKNDNNQTHQSFKCTLKKAINDPNNLKRLNEHVLVINDITSRAYQFIKIVQLLNYDKTGSLKN